MLYKKNAPGDWGEAVSTDKTVAGDEFLTMADGCQIFLRSWKTQGSSAVLVILHGLGGHCAWYIDMANQLAKRGLTVYAMDHRCFGRSKGVQGHIEDYHIFVQDTGAILEEICKRHPDQKIYMLGHSMGGILTTYTAAKYGHLLAGVLYMNPWVRDTTKVPFGTVLAILFGGLVKSRKTLRAAGGSEDMTTNVDAREMLANDPYWRRDLSMSFLFQILQMRAGILKQAKNVTVSSLVMQAENDVVVVTPASKELHETLANSDKTWQTYPGYDHDSQFTADRTLMDDNIAKWIQDRSAQA